ncbi:unnamed protein product [Trichobilharzia szidati]|nr:unnamed protein product [Trichobilharzia szidati]
MTEMVETFDCDLARLAYISFCHLAGGTYIDDCLYNAQSIQKLINQSIFNESSSKSTNDTLNESCKSVSKHSDCNTTTTTTTTNSNNINNIKGAQTTRNKIDFETTLFVNSTLCNDSSFHLRGVWRQIVRDAIENKSFPSVPYKYHGIQIAAFTGHTSKINRITCLNTENCFITSSRDKTVQLWSLATTYNLGSHCLASSSSSSGNQKGNSVSSSSKNTPSVDSNSQQLIARLVYRAHKKSVIAAHYLEPHRLVASIDGNLLFWDPCTGQTVRSNSHSENSGWQNLTALECSAVPYGAVICSDHSAFVHLIDPRVKCSKQTGGLRFHSGASLASFLLSKERIKVETPPTNDSNKTSTNAQDIDLKLTPSYSRSTIDTSITKILHKLTEHLQPNLFHFNNSTSTTTTATTTMMMMHMNMNSNSSTSLMSMNTNMAGVLNRLSMAKNGYYLLCGFTTGIITALDLRMGQVIDIWRGYHDAVVDIVPHKYNGFISCNDRSLSFIYPSANPININPNSLLNSYNQMNNAFNCLTYNSTIQFESEKIILPKLQNITCLTMCKENPIFCATSLSSSSSYSSLSSSSSSSSTSRFPIFGGSSSNPSTNTVSESINDNNPISGLKVNELTGHTSVTPATHSSSISSQAYHHYGNNNNNNCNNNMNNSGGNDSIGGTILGTYLSSSSLSHTTTNNNHNNFNPAYYYTIGRIPPNLLRGNISSILSLTENNFLLVGSDTGGLSVLY